MERVTSSLLGSLISCFGQPLTAPKHSVSVSCPNMPFTHLAWWVSHPYFSAKIHSIFLILIKSKVDPPGIHTVPWIEEAGREEAELKVMRLFLQHNFWLLPANAMIFTT